MLHRLIKREKAKSHKDVVITIKCLILIGLFVLLSGCAFELDQTTEIPSTDNSAEHSSINTNPFKEIEVEKDESRIDQELTRVFEDLEDTDEIDVLLYPREGQVSEGLERFLRDKKKDGLLDYNIMQIANFIAIKGQKQIILEIANRDDVSRITINPRFTTQ